MIKLRKNQVLVLNFFTQLKKFTNSLPMGFFGFFLIVCVPLSAQETIVVGQVFNKFDRAPLQSVSVYFKGSSVQTQTNEEGYFLIRNQGKESVLIFSLIGFRKEEIN